MDKNDRAILYLVFAFLAGTLITLVTGCVSANMSFPGYPGQVCTYRGTAPDNMIVRCVPIK